MRFSENLSNIAAALSEVQAEIRNPIKNNVNRGVQGAPKYANLEDTLQDYVRPVLSMHGMSVFQPIMTDSDGRIGVCTVLFHKSGEFIEGDYVFCDVNVPTNKDGKPILTDGQATGVVITYLRRYSLNAALGINGDKDTDGGYEQNQHQPQQTTVQPAQPHPIKYPEILDEKIESGLHTGKTWREVYKNHIEYIQNFILQENVTDRMTQIVSCINSEINKANAKG